MLHHPKNTLKYEKPASKLNKNKWFTEQEKLLFIK